MQTLSKERLGRFTASKISSLFPGVRGGMSDRDKYVFEKAEEVVKGHPKLFSNKFTEHGLNNEYEAITKFGEVMGLVVDHLQQKYYAINENCGATPDGAVFDFNGVIIGSIDAKCPPSTFFQQKMQVINESKPEYQNSPKAMFYQGQMQMMALSIHNKLLGHPPVTKHYLVRYLTAMDMDYEGNTIEYDLPLESRIFYKVITADIDIQNRILTLVEEASKERDLLVEIFKKPIL